MPSGASINYNQIIVFDIVTVCWIVNIYKSTDKSIGKNIFKLLRRHQRVRNRNKVVGYY